MILPSFNGLSLRMTPRRLGPCLLLVLLTLAQPVCGEVSVPAPVEAVSDEGVELPLPPWVDRFQLATITSLTKFSENLDSFFPNPDNTRFNYDKTRLLVRFGLQLNSEGATRLLQRIDGRIALPRLEERLSLFLREEDLKNNNEAVDELTIFVPRTFETDVRFGLTSGVSIVLAKGAFYKVQNRLGARLYPEWQRFEELGGYLSIPIGRYLLKPAQILFWRDYDGLGETTLVDLDRPLAANLLLRLHSEGTMSEIITGIEYREALYFFHQISPKKGYSLVFEASGATKPRNRFSSYLVGFDWKQRIHKEWLYIEAGVNVDFQRDDNFKPLSAIYVALVVDFNGRHHH